MYMLDELVKIGVNLYHDACMWEAVATWEPDDDEAQRRADVAWSRYEGARKLLSLVFGLDEGTVHDEIDYLMTEAGM